MSEISKLVKKRGYLKTQITKFKNYFDSIKGAIRNTELELTKLQLRSSKIEPLIDEFYLLEESLKSLSDQEGTEVPESNLEYQYFEVIAEVKCYLKANASSIAGAPTEPQSNAIQVQPSQVKLPTIQLPTFYGNCLEWLSFQEIFTSLIENDKNLTDIQKFFYLKGCLKGEALKVIESLDLIGTNYKVALDLLKSRYHNKRVMSNNYIKNLVKFPEIVHPSSKAFRNLIDTFQSHVKVLKSFKLPVGQWDAILVYLMCSKLDLETRKKSEQTSTDEIPTLQEIIDYLSNYCRTLEALDLDFKAKRVSNPLPYKSNYQKLIKNRCPSFPHLQGKLLILSISSRLHEVHTRKLCENCLKPNHSISTCFLLITCKECNKRHHTLLHPPASKEMVSKGEDASDPMSISANLKCLVLEQITAHLPILSFDNRILNIPRDVKLAEPGFHLSRPIDLLIGSELFWDLICEGQVSLGNQLPKLQNTQLGWIVGGPIQNSFNKMCNPCLLNTHASDMDSLLQSFWNIEESYVSDKTPILSEDDKLCEESFSTYHMRDNTGRFVVRLPVKENINELADNRNLAIKRFYHLEQKLIKDSKLRQDYLTFIREYIELGHMEVLASIPSSPRAYFLPHHPVIKEDSTTTKLRVVFDGSAKSSSNFRLNELSLPGPTLQTEFIDVLIRFRMHNFVFTADINKMYRQIWVHPNDQNLQLILWREDPKSPIETYRLKTVTYGLTSSPYLAIRCLHQLANENKESYPLAHYAIFNEVYVDDFLCGGSTLEEALNKRKEVIDVLKFGQFELRKWLSNDNRLLPTNNHSLDSTFSIPSIENTAKVLGIGWKPCDDKLFFSITPFNPVPKLTKRIILSNTAKLFDPLGLVGPVLIHPKIIMQKLWLLQLDWDEAVPNDIASLWRNFTTQLESLSSLIIPRPLSIPNEITTYEVHGFSDASQSAYGACLYLKTITASGVTSVRLICSKSRVALVKTISLPRLELCGAVLLSRLLKRVEKPLQVYKYTYYCWTDSEIVLSWIRATPNSWKVFVSNRITEIQSNTTIKSWNHVKSKSNPADILSRGCLPSEILENQLWWEGPKWLRDITSDWASVPNHFQPSGSLQIPERRQPSLIVIPRDTFDIFLRFSSFIRLQRVVAYCLRFCKILHSKTSIEGPLTSQELHHSLVSILRNIQYERFSDEIHLLKKDQFNKIHGPLSQLTPFLDNDGILRVGGRLTNSSLEYDERHQIILPSNHHVTDLLIEYVHKRILHGGQQATLCSLRRKFWPLTGIRAIRKVLHRCHPCFRANPHSLSEQMGNLPKMRSEPSRPFINSGLDYGGPIYLREGKGRRKTLVKAYIALFVCCSTKAIHIELVGDLTTEAFLNAFKRFISRRGYVQNVYCDNGTNFRGAYNELTSLLKTESVQTNIKQYGSRSNVQFHFIPQNSPHMGGLWEAGIKTVKAHIKRVIGSNSLTFEEMNTLIQIEACVNSRPLIPISSDPTDLSALTPSHFLIGEVLTEPLEPDLRPILINRLSRWQHIQKMKQDFWQRWSNEYLHTLQQRTKWTARSGTEIKIGTLVILKNENLPPLLWNLGRVMELHPGKDGLIRVVSVKTARGLVKRAIARLCKLPLSE